MVVDKISAAEQRQKKVGKTEAKTTLVVDKDQQVSVSRDLITETSEHGDAKFANHKGGNNKAQGYNRYK